MGASEWEHANEVDEEDDEWPGHPAVDALAFALWDVIAPGEDVGPDECKRLAAKVLPTLYFKGWLLREAP